MTGDTKIGLGLLVSALALGALGEALFYGVPPGVNVALWCAALLGIAVGLARWNHLPFYGEGRWLIAPILFFAGALAWRDSPVLQGLDILTLLILLALFAMKTRYGSLRMPGFLRYLSSVLLAGLNALLGIPM